MADDVSKVTPTRGSRRHHSSALRPRTLGSGLKLTLSGDPSLNDSNVSFAFFPLVASAVFRAAARSKPPRTAGLRGSHAAAQLLVIELCR